MVVVVVVRRAWPRVGCGSRVGTVCGRGSGVEERGDGHGDCGWTCGVRAYALESRGVVRVYCFCPPRLPAWVHPLARVASFSPPC